jgi:hypothetical protein
MQVTEHELIGRIAHDILKEFTGLVSRNDVLSLSTLYRLLNLVEDIEIMRTAWGNYIKVPPISSFPLSPFLTLPLFPSCRKLCLPFSPFLASPLSLLPVVSLPETYVQDTGAELVNNPSHDEEMIPSLLQFKSRLDALLLKPPLRTDIARIIRTFHQPSSR